LSNSEKDNEMLKFAIGMFVTMLLVVIVMMGLQPVPPEEMARVLEERHQAELRLQAAKERLQRTWDASPFNPNRK
jgi:hypothetical protein